MNGKLAQKFLKATVIAGGLGLVGACTTTYDPRGGVVRAPAVPVAPPVVVVNPRGGAYAGQSGDYYTRQVQRGNIIANTQRSACGHFAASAAAARSQPEKNDWNELHNACRTNVARQYPAGQYGGPYGGRGYYGGVYGGPAGTLRDIDNTIRAVESLGRTIDRILD